VVKGLAKLGTAYAMTFWSSVLTQASSWRRAATPQWRANFIGAPAYGQRAYEWKQR